MKTTLERYSDAAGMRAIYARAFGCELWGEWHSPGPSLGWGVEALSGGTTLYMGRLSVTLSRVMQRRADASEPSTAPI